MAPERTKSVHQWKSKGDSHPHPHTTPHTPLFSFPFCLWVCLCEFRRAFFPFFPTAVLNLLSFLFCSASTLFAFLFSSRRSVVSLSPAHVLRTASYTHHSLSLHPSPSTSPPSSPKQQFRSLLFVFSSGVLQSSPCHGRTRVRSSPLLLSTVCFHFFFCAVLCEEDQLFSFFLYFCSFLFFCLGRELP